jgi:hypothetical protein
MMIDMLHQIFVVVEVIFYLSKCLIFLFFLQESPSRAEWDDEDSDKRRSQWEYPTPNDNYNRRRQRDTDYYNR